MSNSKRGVDKRKMDCLYLYHYSLPFSSFIHFFIFTFSAKNLFCHSSPPENIYPFPRTFCLFLLIDNLGKYNMGNTYVITLDYSSPVLPCQFSEATQVWIWQTTGWLIYRPPKMFHQRQPCRACCETAAKRLHYNSRCSRARILWYWGGPPQPGHSTDRKSDCNHWDQDLGSDPQG